MYRCLPFGMTVFVASATFAQPVFTPFVSTFDVDFESWQRTNNSWVYDAADGNPAGSLLCTLRSDLEVALIDSPDVSGTLGNWSTLGPRGQISFDAKTFDDGVGVFRLGVATGSPTAERSRFTVIRNPNTLGEWRTYRVDLDDTRWDHPDDFDGFTDVRALSLIIVGTGGTVVAIDNVGITLAETAGPADIAVPFGVLDSVDIQTFLADVDPTFAEPSNVSDFFDVIQFLRVFDEGPQ